VTDNELVCTRVTELANMARRLLDQSSSTAVDIVSTRTPHSAIQAPSSQLDPAAPPVHSLTCLPTPEQVAASTDLSSGFFVSPVGFCSDWALNIDQRHAFSG
jgi:hypothetical protein